MNQSPEQAPMSAEDQALMSAAQQNEVQALNEYLQNRVLILNVEVRRRDARIAELEAALASAQSVQPSPDAWDQAPVSGTSEGPAPQ